MNKNTVFAFFAGAALAAVGSDIEYGHVTVVSAVTFATGIVAFLFVRRRA